MEIIVCVKRVPDVTEAELAIDKNGGGILSEDLDFGINEWDNFAIEAAVQLKETHGGTVTAITMGDEEAEEVLRRALAMGADEAVHLMDPAFEGSDAFGVATILKRAIDKRPHDLVLTGAISSDEGAGSVGGMLAALLEFPMVALATTLEVEGQTATVRHEVEQGLERVVAVDLPAVVTVQSGMNEPRYVSIRGIRKVAEKPVVVWQASDLGLTSSEVGKNAAMVKLQELFLPPRARTAEFLEGDDETIVATLLERLHEKGGI